jgi:hypothetical protein
LLLSLTILASQQLCQGQAFLQIYFDNSACSAADAKCICEDENFVSAYGCCLETGCVASARTSAAEIGRSSCSAVGVSVAPFTTSLCGTGAGQTLSIATSIDVDSILSSISAYASGFSVPTSAFIITVGSSEISFSVPGVATQTATSTSGAASQSAASPSNSGGSDGLSTGAKIGIGVGIGVAAVLVVLLIACLLLSRHKHKKAAQSAAAMNVQSQDKPPVGQSSVSPAVTTPDPKPVVYYPPNVAEVPANQVPYYNTNTQQPPPQQYQQYQNSSNVVGPASGTSSYPSANAGIMEMPGQYQQTYELPSQRN